jgi:hypothetical protein
MMYVALGLLLAALFGIFFGSEGEMEKNIFAMIFWGLIEAGMLGQLLSIIGQQVCRHHRFHFCHH